MCMQSCIRVCGVVCVVWCVWCGVCGVVCVVCVCVVCVCVSIFMLALCLVFMCTDCQASPWNVKKMAYSYNASNGAPVKNIASPPPGDAALMPSPKRRMNIGGGLDIVRPTGEHRPGGLMMGNKGSDF